MQIIAAIAMLRLKLPPIWSLSLMRVIWTGIAGMDGIEWKETGMGQEHSHARRAERLPLVLPARCRSRSGFLDRVVITDISIWGCRIQSFALTMHQGDLVVVRPESLEGLCGVIRWVHDHAAGIEFDRPLYGPVVDHMHRHHGHFARSAHDPATTWLRLVA